MSVIPITIFFSLLLAGLFIALFAYEQNRRRFASVERDSLLPLADEKAKIESGPEQDHGHAAADDCGCHDGRRPPCAGCVKRTH
jgi:cbb3-type cytochrome oxidase subunit 3